MKRKPSRNKPSYSQTVRNGLAMIALNYTPRTREERRALAWIRDMNAWHVKVVQPAERFWNTRTKALRAMKEACA